MGARTGRRKGGCSAAKSLGFSHATWCLVSSHEEFLDVKCRRCSVGAAKER